MSKFVIDYNSVIKNTFQKTYKLSDVKDKLEKVAFDLVRFKDSTKDELWQIQSAEDGEYIVALYEEDTNSVNKSEASWAVGLNKMAGTLDFFYNNEPVCNINAMSIGLDEKSLEGVPELLPKQLTSNKKLVNSLFKQVSPQTKEYFYNKYPELKS